MQIVSALVELNDRSNISGTSGDKDFEKTWLPAGYRNMVISDTEETSEEEVGVLLDGTHNQLDQELPDLYASVAPRPSISSGQPPMKRCHKERRVWEWEKRVLPHQVPHMPHSPNPPCPTCHILRILSAPHPHAT